MIRPGGLFETRSSSSGYKLPLAFAFGSWLALFFLSKAGLPTLSSPLALMACWFIEKRSFFTSLIGISLLSAILDPLWGTGSKMWMVCHTLASVATYSIQPSVFNFPTHMKWAIRVFFWSFALMSLHYVLYEVSSTQPNHAHYLGHFLEFFALSLYDSFILGSIAWIAASLLKEE